MSNVKLRPVNQIFTDARSSDKLALLITEGAADEITYEPPAPAIVLPEKTDIGAMAYIGTGSAAVSVEFQILLVDN